MIPFLGPFLFRAFPGLFGSDRLRPVEVESENPNPLRASFPLSGINDKAFVLQPGKADLDSLSVKSGELDKPCYRRPSRVVFRIVTISKTVENKLVCGARRLLIHHPRESLETHCPHPARTKGCELQK